MHDQFPTRCCETRVSHHFLLPLTYTNAINAAKYFEPTEYPATLTSKAMLSELAAAMVHNPAWLAMLRTKPQCQPGTKSGVNYHPGTRGSSSMDGGPPSRESPHKHILIPLSQIPGYKSSRQQRCDVCDVACSWACARCSTKDHWVALHPLVTQGSKRPFNCLKAHRHDPFGSSYSITHEKCSGTSRKARSRRRIPVEVQF